MPSLATIFGRGGVPFTVNSEHAQRFQDFLNDPEWGDYGFDPKQSGGYNPRNIAGTNKPSLHAFGNAIDLNWSRNARGTQGDIPPDLARRLAQKHGLTWGGDWRNPDPMHFEVASGAPARPAAPQPPDGMDNATYRGTSPITTGSTGVGLISNPQDGAAVNARSPEAIAQDRALAQALMEGAFKRPHTSVWGNIGDLSQMLVGGLYRDRGERDERTGRQAAAEALQRALAGGAPNAAALVAAASLPQASPIATQVAGHVISSQIDQNSPDAQLKRQAAQFAYEQAQKNAPLDTQLKEAQVKAAGNKDVKAEAEAQILRGLVPEVAGTIPGYQPMPPNGPRLQQQSGEAPLDPNIIRTQATAGPPGAPQPQPNPNADLIDTPFGKMTREKALKLGGALSLMGKGDAGKMLVEAAGVREGAISKPTQHDLDKTELGFTNMQAAFGEIRRLYDPKFLQGSPKIAYAINNFRDKWAPDTLKNLKLTPQEQADLAKYEKFGATAMNNLNTRLKELSGTAVTETEMNRILRELPSPGTGPFSGDGPTAFTAKLDQGERLTKLGIARMRYLRTHGFTGNINEEVAKTVPLDNMPAIIDRRGSEILQKLKTDNPGATDDQLIPQALEATKREFGI